MQIICLGQYFEYIMASEEPLLKLLPCLIKKNCLHTDLLGMKRRAAFRLNYSYGGYCEVCDTSEAVVETNITWI